MAHIAPVLYQIWGIVSIHDDYAIRIVLMWTGRFHAVLDETELLKITINVVIVKHIWLWCQQDLCKAIGDPGFSIPSLGYALG